MDPRMHSFCCFVKNKKCQNSCAITTVTPDTRHLRLQQDTPPSLPLDAKHIALPTTRCHAHHLPYYSMPNTSLLPPPLLLLLFYWCHCCGRGMCCPSTQHVWVDAEWMSEWMVNACVSGECMPSVYVWVHIQCMYEWMLSVCVSGCWMHVWVVSGCRMYVWVDAECMCEWMLNACVSGETI